MADEIILDLGKYGEVIVESVETRSEDGFVQAGRMERKRVPCKFGASALQAPLTGLGKLFMATLPQPQDDDLYEVDEFCVEFGLGIGAEVELAGGGTIGVNVGPAANAEVKAIVKLVPGGTFKCTYTWKRKKAQSD